MGKSSGDDPLVALARQTIEAYVRNGVVPEIDVPIPAELEARAGAFVCLKCKGELRGCIGTIEATQPNLASEIVQNAISAALRDPRFEPVICDELDDLDVTVDVLGAAERIHSLNDLDPKVYGVIVESGFKRGLLLPDLEGVDTVEQQVSIALRKAGIYADEPVTVYRFEVTRHE